MRIILRKISIILLLSVSFYSLYANWRRAISLDVVNTGSQAIDNWELRLQPVKKSLPVKRGEIGYLVEWDVPGMRYAFGDLDAEFMLSQYSLAPFVLLRGARAEWNVALLDLDAIHKWEQVNPGQYEIIHLKGNVYLVHRLDMEQP